jgi:uncharacterized membrane protein
LEKYLYILIEYLKTESYHIDRQKFKERLLSDPNNIVASITNTLDYFEIKNIVAEVPKESFNSLPNTFIAQFSKNNQFTFVLVNKEKDKLNIIVDETSNVLITNKEFLENWTGLIIAIEKNENKKKNIYQKEIILKTVFIVFTLLAILHISIITKSFLQTGHFTLSIIGFIISFLIVKEKLNLNSVPSKFCTLTKNSNCETVLNSKESRIFGFVDLSDSSIVYFSFVVLAFIYNPSSALFNILSLLSLPVIIYSIFYQKFKIKKWCPLCLGIASVLALQFIVALLAYKKPVFEFKEIILLLLLLGFVMSIWFIIKPLLITKQEYNALRIENLTFRRNYHLFLPYYHSLKAIDTYIPNSIKISLGTENPIIDLIFITNPMCENCKDVHNIYTRLLQKYPNEIQLTFLFLVSYKNREDIETKISERLLQIYHEKGKLFFKEALKDWFIYINSKGWFEKWGKNRDKKYNTILKTQVNWCLQNKVTSTPRLIINGKKNLENYQIKDIENFIEPILEFEKNKNIHA